MNSKQALDKLFMACDNDLLYEQSGIMFATELTNIIEQDLNKLEKLNILIKALYNGIYVKQLGIGNTNYMKTIITKVRTPCLKLDHKTHTELVFAQKRSGGYWDTYYLNDYGKTWALTKEELKDD